MDCMQNIRKKACVQARVRVIPETEVGKVEVECIGRPKRRICEGKPRPVCEFIISQMVCLTIPIRFSAKAVVREKGIVCKTRPDGCELHPHNRT